MFGKSKLEKLQRKLAKKKPERIELDKNMTAFKIQEDERQERLARGGIVDASDERRKLKKSQVKKEIKNLSPEERENKTPKFNLLDKNDPNRKGAPSVVAQIAKNTAKNFTAPIDAFTKGVTGIVGSGIKKGSNLVSETKKWNEDRKSKKEIHSKLPTERVKDFINEFKLDSILTPEFEGLDGAQKLKVTQDLKRRVVDLVKSDAQTQYSEDLKNKSWIKSIASSIKKESDLKNIEREVFEKLKNTPEGQEIIRENLEILTKNVQNKIVGVEGNGSVNVYYLFSDAENRNFEEESAVDRFNVAANAFTQMPYEWGQEKGGKHRKEYDKAEAEYNEARNEALEIKTNIEKPENKGRAMLEILEIDNALKMEQLLNTHPEFEKELNNFARSVGGAEYIKIAGNFLNNITGGKNWTNKLLTAGGFGARMLAKGAAMASGATIVTAISAPIIGGTIGGLRARFRAKTTLEERQKGARHGQKDESAEARNVVTAENLNKRMAEMLEALANASTTEEKAKRLDQINRRIDFTQDKIEKGLVNFGDAKSMLNNQFNLVDNLNKALVASASEAETTRKDIDARLEKFLSYKTGKIEESQKKFINKQMRKGIYAGATFATAGYVLRYAGEQLGWWGHHGAETITKEELPTNPPPTYNEIANLKNEYPWLKTRADYHTISELAKQNNNITHGTNIPSTSSPLTNNLNIENFSTEGVKSDHEKGALEVLRLAKKQLRDKYADLSKAPEALQDFMKEENLVKQAKELGFYKPNSVEESALLHDEDILKFDEHGNLLFGKPDAAGNIPILKHYEGKMFDLDHSGPVHPDRHHNFEKDIKIAENDEMEVENYNTEETLTPPIDTDAQVEQSIIRAKIEKGYQDPPWRLGIYDAEKVPEKLRTDGQFNHDAYSVEHARSSLELSAEERDLYNSRFINNSFDLSRENLMHAFHTMQKDRKFIIGDEEESIWRNLRNMKANNAIKHINTSGDNPAMGRLSKYLRVLRSFAGFGPKGGLFGFRAETTEQYMARALQKITMDGRVEDFEARISK